MKLIQYLDLKTTFSLLSFMYTKNIYKLFRNTVFGLTN